MNQIITTPAVVADLNGVFVDLFARLDAISQAVADHQASTDAGFEQVGVVLDAVVEVKDRQDGFAGTLQGIVTVQDQIVGTLQSVAVQLQAMAAEIASKSEVERSRYQLMLSIAQAHMARYEAAADMLMKNGEISIQSALQAENMMLRAQETATTTLAQMAAGYTSAANVSASIDDRSSASLNYNFSGELDLR